MEVDTKHYMMLRLKNGEGTYFFELDAETGDRYIPVTGSIYKRVSYGEWKHVTDKESFHKLFYKVITITNEHIKELMGFLKLP